MKLTKKDEEVLTRSIDLKDNWSAGIGPRRGGQFKQFRKLAELGLLTFAGLGSDLDGEIDSEVMVYELTEEGETLGRKLACA